MRRFLLPDGEFVELLRTPDIALLGSATYYGVALTEMPPPEGYAYRWRNNVVFAIFAIKGVMIGKAQAEMIVLDSDSARLLIMSTAALGFDGREAYLSAKYAHLDFMTSVKARDRCEGVLPELWGFRPFSAATT